MSKLVHDEKRVSTSSLLSSASDQHQGASIAGQRQLESTGGGRDGRPPGEQAATAARTTTTTATAPYSGLFSEKAGFDASISEARLLLRAAEASHGVEESVSTESIGNSKNRQRFDLTYQKYYSDPKLVDEQARVEKALFSSSIIAVDKSTETSRGSQRPEKCKESQRRCSSAETFASHRPFAIPVSSSVVVTSSKRPESAASSMPAAAACSTLDPGATVTKLASLNANFSLPPSPQRSSSSSTSDGGTSAFLAMAKRLHRLRLAAASPSRSNNDDPVSASKDFAREEFISIRPLDSSQNVSLADEPKDKQMSHLAVTTQDDRRASYDVSAGQQPMLSEMPSATPSLSDISSASFYRLPAAQTQTFGVAGLQRQGSSSSMGRSKVWTSEPILAPQNEAMAGSTMPNMDQLADLNEGYGGRNAPTFLASATERQRNLLMPLGTENVFSARFSEFMHTLHGSGHGGGAEIDNGRVQDDREASWRYSTFQREPLPAAGVLDGYRVNSSAVADNVGVSNWPRPTTSQEHAASLPPLPPSQIGSRNGLLRPSDMNHGSDIPSASGVKHGEANSARERVFPDSISRLMDAVARHPTGDLDHSKLKTILREQRKSYKRRLERERAKREALEDLLVKLNTPRLQQRSFSNSSSTASTVRNAHNRRATGENGRSSADLGDIVINSLRSSSVDATSTASEDAFLLELIQQHLRMKQALIGHLGKRTNGSSSTSGGEQENREHGTARRNEPTDLKQSTHSPNGFDDDDIPMGGEAASGAAGRTHAPASASARQLNGRHVATHGFPYGTNSTRPSTSLPKSKSADHGRATGGGVTQLNGLIDKEDLRLPLDNNSSTGGSENGGRSSSSERRKQRKRWETNSSGRSGIATERDQGGHTGRTASSARRLGSAAATPTPRPSVAFFVPADPRKPEEAKSELTELNAVKPLQNVFQERQSKFIQRSITRQDKIKAASELRAEAARRVRELADNVAHGRIRMEDASEQLLLYELPQPSAFSRLEMFKASKLKYEQLPETVARRNKMKRESDLATNRVMARMFKQKMAYKRLLKKAEKQGLASTVPSSVLGSNGPPSVRLLNR